MNKLVSPSILGVSKSDLKIVVPKLLEAKADLIHFDVMDGKFVTNSSFNDDEIDIVSNLVKDKIIDVHLMVDDVVSYVHKFDKEKVNYITFHADKLQVPQMNIYIDMVHYLGHKVGLALNPDIPVYKIRWLLMKVDLVLVMSVQAGKGGQAFIPGSINKIKELNQIRKDNDYHYLIEVDGGINDITSKECIKAGADILVAGSYILKSDNYEERINKLK